MNVTINDNTIIEFCKKYPSFSVEKLLLEYIHNVQSLNLHDAADILQLTKSTIEANIKDLSIEFTDTLTSSLDKICKVSDLQNIPNNATIQYLRDILNTSASKHDLRYLSNEPMTKHIQDAHVTTKELHSTLTEYINTFKTGSVKGRITEVKTVIQLDNIFPKHDVLHVPSSLQKGKMDIILSLDNHPDISIDTKVYAKAVPKAEVMKFENDIIYGKTHGIMVSLSSKITSKPHFTINVIKSKVAIYLSNTKGDTECIINAVNVIYEMSKFLGKGDTGISESVLIEIQDLLKGDTQVINNIKSNLTQSLEELKKLSTLRIQSLLKN